MKAKKYNWLLKLCYVVDDGDYRVSYVNVLDSTRNEVMRIVNKYRKDFVIVSVYKLQPAL